LVEWTYCYPCNRFFKSQACFDRHKASTTETGKGKRKRVMTICQRYRRCDNCERLVDYSKIKTRQNGVPVHTCWTVFCAKCRIEHALGEKECYLQPVVDQKEEEKRKQRIVELVQEGLPLQCLDLYSILYDLEDQANDTEDTDEEASSSKERGTKIFFDFECTQEKFVETFEREGMDPGFVYEHMPNLCVALKVCRNCKQKTLRERQLNTCKFCGQSEHIFEGKNCRDEFCSWLFSEENRGATAIAHNAKGYDAQFLAQYLIKEAMAPKVITKGLEFMSMQFGGIRVIDSLNFLPMALASLPAAFGETELKKGYFPHMFNREENWDYKGPFPEARYYEPDRMTEAKREKFLKWYDEQKDKEFDFRTEILEYCRSDVDILARCCTDFEELFEQVCNVRPFDVAVTIASACMYTFRKNFLKPNTIATIPHGGYNGKDRHSKDSLKWLKWISRTEGIHIQHAGNGREFKVGRLRVDGYCQATNTIYEYHVSNSLSLLLLLLLL
jgi:hypothetical protein